MIKRGLAVLLLLIASPAAASSDCLPGEYAAITADGIEAIRFGALGHQGQSQPPRSEPPWEFSEWRAAVRSSIRWKLEEAGLPMADLLLFAFERRQPVPAPLEGPDAEPDGPIFVPLAPETLWCLVALSDHVVFLRGTSHMTTVFEVERTNDAIYFADPWPEGFPLPVDDFEIVPFGEIYDDPGLVRPSKKVLVKLSREVFERRVHSLYKLGIRTLPKAVFNLEPTADEDPFVHLAFGLTFLRGSTFADWYDLRYVREAVGSLRSALNAAPEGAKDLRRFVAGKLYLAERLAAPLGSTPSEGTAVSAERPASGFSKADLEAAFDRNDHFQLGLSYGVLRDYDNAIRHFGTALDIDPDWSTALASRALARWENGDRAGAVGDAERALERVAAESAVLTARIAARDPSDIIGAHLHRDATRRLDFLTGKVLKHVLMAQRSSDDRKLLLKLYAQIAKVDGRTATRIARYMLERDPDAMLREKAARALGKHSSAADAVPALRAAVACDEKWNVRQNALVALINLGEEAAEAMPQAMAALLDPNYDVRYTAEIYLGRHDAAEEAGVVSAAKGEGGQKPFEAVIADLVSSVVSQEERRDVAARALVLTARGVCAPSFAPRARRVPRSIQRVYGDAHDALAAHPDTNVRQSAAELAEATSAWSN